MGMLVTTLGFLLMSAILIALHLRSHGRAKRQRGAALATPPCPRCGARAPATAGLCPSCGVPLQAYEVVSARTAKRAAASGGADAGDRADAGDGSDAGAGRLHAVVRADTCVGCGTCVSACPEPGAIRIEHKLAVVDLDRCRGHGDCAAACPTSAIVVTSGAAVQRVEVPALNAHFESNVRGLYVVGELGGRGLIKNAINEGKIAVEHVATVLGGRRRETAGRPGAPRGVPAGDVPLFDVVIVGSGPAGLSAGLTAHAAGLRYLVLEQGTPADSIRKYPRHKLLLAEPVRVPLYGDLWIADASKEELLQVWQNIIQKHRLQLRTGERVEDIARQPDGSFVVTAAGRASGGAPAARRRYAARRVVLALGRRGTPRRLGVPGEELDKVFYDIVEMEAFAGTRVLVVGGGDSAIESVLGLANQAATGVTLSYRGTDFNRVKGRNRTRLAAAVAAGKLRLLLESQVIEIRRDAVVIAHQGRQVSLPNDHVIIRIGGDAPYPFLERIGVQIVQKEIDLAPVTPEPQAAIAG